MSFVDKLLDSAKDTFSLGNLFKRLFSFLFFGFLLGIRYLIEALDGARGWGYLGALSKSTLYGVGVSLASINAIITNFNTYIQNSWWGSIIFGVFMIIAVVGFFFQPVSMIVNLFDFKGRSQTGNESGQYFNYFIRGVFTVVLVLVLSFAVVDAEISESILSDTTNTVDDDLVNLNINETVENLTQPINKINMLTGGT